ncbi:MAG TPA: sigma-70 family RNA polymerase sigma factor [Pirellulales bacterium]|nr:sigma-70 family RNA polymerase sigma factor [Pirellulales bacterium]
MSAEDEPALPDFSKLMVERRGALLAYIERRMGAALRGKIEPEDVLQEVGVEIARTAGAEVSPVAPGRDPFGWLCDVAERRIVDAYRRIFGAQKRSAAREVSLQGDGADDSRPGLLNLLVASLTSPTQALARDDRHQRLAAALATLNEEQREALRLRYVEQMPSKEIAKWLGKSDGAVRVMLTRALKSLQTVLTDAGLSGHW